MNSNDFVSIEHILAESLMNVNDVDLRNGFTKGWFVSRIQDALQELAFDTFYQKITNDFTLPSNLAITLPKNAFNIREIYAFNESCCTSTTSAVVHWKRLYNNNAGNSGSTYTSRITGTSQQNNSDHFLPYHEKGDSKLYANVQNGTIMFSSSCSKYKKIRLVYNGMGGEIGEEPIIPRFFERFINDYIEERYYSAMKAREPKKFRTLWVDSWTKLEKSLSKAKMRVSSMNTFEKESIEEYISNIYSK